MSTSNAVENFESTTTSTVLEFTVFHKLLPELRIMVWNFAASHQRTITIHDCGGFGCQRTDRFAKHNATAVPGVLHTNSEARTTALKHYTLLFGPQFNGNPIYFNHNADGLCFPNFNDLDAFYGLLNRGLFGLVTRPTKLQVTPAHLELESNLKRLVIGSSNIYLRNWLLERFWRVDEVLIEIPGTPTQDWDTILAGLVNKWDVASKGQNTPRTTLITWEKLLDIIREEMAKSPKIKAEKERIAARAASKKTLLAVGVAERQIRDATTRSTSSSRKEV